MTTKETTGDPSAADVRDAITGPQLALQSVYLKDCSYEAPNGPAHWTARGIRRSVSI